MKIEFFLKYFIVLDVRYNTTGSIEKLVYRELEERKEQTSHRQ